MKIDKEDKWWNVECKNRMKFLKEFISFNNKESKLLDIGCYKCFLSTLLPKTIEYYGIDFKNFKRYTNKNIKIQDLNKETKLFYPDKYFDYIIATGILEHIFFIDKMMLEIKRVLKDSGYVIIGLPNEKNLMLRLNLLLGKEPLVIEEQKIQHHWFFTLQISKEWISHYFKIIEIKSYIGCFGRKYIPDFLVNKYPNLFASEHFFKCMIK